MSPAKRKSHVYQRPGSPFYWYTFRIDKRHFRGSTRCTTAREAEAFARAEYEKRKLELATGSLTPTARSVALAVAPESDAPICAEVFARYWNAYGSKLAWAGAVRDHMREALAIIGPDTPLDRWTNAVTAEVLDEFASSTDRRYTLDRDAPAPVVKPGTVNRRLAVLRQIHYKARDVWDLPVAKIKWGEHHRTEPKERVRHATVEQAKRVISELPQHIQIMVAWSLSTGCRLSETYSLRKSRINYDSGTAEVETKGKGDVTRHINLNADALLVLSLCNLADPPEHLKIGKDDCYVFDATNRRKHWEAAVLAAGLDDFHWHDLRHTFATWLGSSGAGLHVIQKALGHAKIETTMKYLHVIRADVANAVSKLPTVLEHEVITPMKLIGGETKP